MCWTRETSRVAAGGCGCVGSMLSATGGKGEFSRAAFHGFNLSLSVEIEVHIIREPRFARSSGCDPDVLMKYHDHRPR
ncbi:hypothetical protein BJX66DRAFT_300573 [Aspergillus keveii]|uniref:Uncharacterized protein n=1 Tax=Aspergillus keveii TaxID=714993 RepID=A0ABR4GA59_9EURO